MREVPFFVPVDRPLLSLRTPVLGYPPTRRKEEVPLLGYLRPLYLTSGSSPCDELLRLFNFRSPFWKSVPVYERPEVVPSGGSLCVKSRNTQDD